MEKLIGITLLQKIVRKQKIKFRRRRPVDDVNLGRALDRTLKPAWEIVISTGCLDYNPDGAMDIRSGVAAPPPLVH
jgi:hypothetical protein